MKKLVSLLMTLVMLCSLMAPALAEADTRVFVDSLGREVTLPQRIERIAVTGTLGQIVVFAIGADLMVGIAEPWSEAALPFLQAEYASLPVIGQVYGGKGEMNLEELLRAEPQVVIDVGEPKPGVGEDLDALQQQTGLPWVHISAYIDRMEETYTLLGQLLGREAEGQALADYCRATYARVAALAQSGEKVNALLVLGEKGINVLARGTFNSVVVDQMVNNLAEVDNPASKGTGNEVDMEQILIWNPDVLLVVEKNVYDSLPQDPLWQSVTAVKTNAYYRVPVGPYNWVSTPPSVQRLLGMLWLGKLFYPEADYDLYTEVARYFDLFYHWDLTQEQYDVLMADSLGH